MINETLMKEIISDFHQRSIPEFTHRQFDLTCPKNKIRSLIGIRRAGKTYTFYQLISQLITGGVEKEGILFMNFEDERLLPFESQNLTLLLNSYYELFPSFKDRNVYLFLDEIQNIVNWERFIRRIHESENVQINLTGSSSNLLSHEIATALRGRTLSYEIFPFSFGEFLSYKKVVPKFNSSKDRSHIIHAFEDYLIRGGFPEVLACSESLRIRILQDYFNMILYRDLIDRYDIRNHSLIKYLLKSLLSNNANPFSVNKFANDSKSQGYRFSKDSIHNYISYLQDGYCFSFVPILSDSTRKRQVNYKKIYAIDHGLVTATVGTRSYNIGRLLETMVYNHLRNRYSRNQIFYYKTDSGFEIDFVTIHRGNVNSIIQVCENLTDAATRERETRSIAHAMEALGLGESIIITRNERDILRSGNNRIYILPFWQWAIESNY
jgi:predicted AAA+ superfamily ATPase